MDKDDDLTGLGLALGLELYDIDGNCYLDLDPDDPDDRATYLRLWDPDYRRVALDDVDDVRVSTVFLAINHSPRHPRSEAPPILFETMVFDYIGDRDEYQWRYETKEQAQHWHKRIVEAVRAGTLDQLYDSLG